MWTIFSISLFPLTKKSTPKLNFLLNKKSRKLKLYKRENRIPLLNWQNNPERAKRKEEILD